MSTTVYLSGHLKSFSGGGTEFSLAGDHKTVGDVLNSLWAERPALRDRVLNEQGDIRQHVNIFLDGRDVRRSDSLDTDMGTCGELYIFNAVSGG